MASFTCPGGSQYRLSNGFHSLLLGYTPLMKEIYGKKAIPRDRNKTAGTRAPPWYL
jgi:hypothetical protein